ncbi:hypothetical protein [Corynebacterium endometrii]|uniref:Uncharacterized protein n=1 Tax=Corynebacterium endometrii TaxID=2488819 RepID=A0A4P7QIZ8_9CORY|nr:hypothetical protein [Corynebacterium endometrii]QCB29076.1 hypothetical protein CENDO_09055 [Corynebacterium endometrii]
MSIDNLFDSWAEETGVKRTAPVVPDHPCQIFEGETPRDELDAARDTIRTILSD